METTDLLSTITEAAADIKALDMITFDLEGKSSLTEFVVICHGTSTAHTKGIADKIVYTLKRNNLLPLGIEGAENGEWILMDYNAVIVHIFLQEMREHYQIEELFQEFNQRPQ